MQVLYCQSPGDGGNWTNSGHHPSRWKIEQQMITDSRTGKNKESSKNRALSCAPPEAGGEHVVTKCGPAMVTQLLRSAPRTGTWKHIIWHHSRRVWTALGGKTRTSPLSELYGLHYHQAWRARGWSTSPATSDHVLCLTRLPRCFWPVQTPARGLERLERPALRSCGPHRPACPPPRQRWPMHAPWIFSTSPPHPLLTCSGRNPRAPRPWGLVYSPCPIFCFIRRADAGA